MNELFGISMTTIMIYLLAALAVCLVGVLGIGLLNRTMFRMGLRNIPRRTAQSALVVLGLMLATLIISAAFTTGDSLDYSITRDVYQILGPNDEVLELKGGAVESESANPYVPADVVGNLEGRFGADPNIDGFTAAILETAPVFNPETRQSEPRMNLAGVDPARIARVGGLRLENGRPLDLAALPDGSVYLNPKAADILDAKTGDSILIIVGNQPRSFTVAGIARPELLTGWRTSGPGTRDTGGVTMTLAQAQRLLGRDGQVNFIGVSNAGGVRGGEQLTDAVTGALQPVFDDPAARAQLGLADYAVNVADEKKDGVEEAKLISNVFTTVFLVLGLFSIAAGVLLIFMIFVMLAAERKTEMGMARAVGLKRRNLIQSFIAEGMAYDLASGVVGAALGIGAAFLLVVVATRFIFGDSFSIDLRVTPRSLVIAYALGVVLTFLTVGVSAWRVSKLNIVAAIRDISDSGEKRAGRGSLIWGSILTVVAVLLLFLGSANNSAFAFYSGMTLILLSIPLILRFFGAPPRPVFTVAGALIFLGWSLPDQWSRRLFGTLDGDIEMFFLSGVGMVIGSTLILVYNARVLTNLFQGGRGRGVWLVPALLAGAAAVLAGIGIALDGEAQGLSQLLYMAAGLAVLLFAVSLFGNRAQRFAPALKMAIAYPLANRFRTGMTIAMFSLIVFSITVMSTLTANFAALFVSDEARAGWDITAIVNPNNPVTDFRAALVEAGFERPDDLREVARATFPSEQRVAPDGEKEVYLTGADDAYFRTVTAAMDVRARGYESDAAVWEAVRTTPGLVVIDGTAIVEGGFGDPEAYRLEGVKRGENGFEPVRVELRDPVTGQTSAVTVIGVVDDRVSFSVLFGMLGNLATYTEVAGPPQANRVFVQAAPGVDTKALNKEIKAALVGRGVESFDLRTQLKEEQQLQIGFNQIFQGFMALGLFVGVAALGVIAFRSVVERRQQIGMLRALGFQKGTVALSFMLESSFISILGVLAGLIGATILSRNLFYSDDFTEVGDLAFTIPWLTVVGFLVAGIGFALLMTWLPARRASSVPIAEALRYE